MVKLNLPEIRKIVLLVAFLINTPAVIWAQDDVIVTKQYDDGGMYVGTFKNGLQHGTGTYTLPNGYEYNGQWVNGEIRGIGIAKFPNGSVYKGNFIKGKPEGSGKIIFADGATYEGTWLDGKITGQGIAVYANGSRFEGGFSEAMHHGQGVMTNSDGYIYDGDWVNGVKEGSAKITYPDGSVYSGSVIRGAREGKGTLEMPEGLIFEGFWKNGEINGLGKVTEPNGDVYKGELSNGKRNGKGIVEYANGDLISGYWQNGKLVTRVAKTPDNALIKPTIRPESSLANLIEKIDEIVGGGLDPESLEAKCSYDPAGCNFTQLCEKATIGDYGSKSWNTDAQAYVKLAKEYALECGVNEKTSSNTTQKKYTCSAVSPEYCSEKIICHRATYGAGDTLAWETLPGLQGYVGEAKKRGLGCGMEPYEDHDLHRIGKVLLKQIEPCWNVDISKKNTSVTVSFSLDKNGKVLNNDIRLVSSEGKDGIVIRRSFVNAKKTIFKCQKKLDGFNLHDFRYDAWSNIVLTFNPPIYRQE